MRYSDFEQHRMDEAFDAREARRAAGKRYEQERADLFDAIAFWHGAVIHAKDEDTRQFARAQIDRLRCKMTVLEYEHGERSWNEDVRAVRAMQDDQDAEELF